MRLVQRIPFTGAVGVERRDRECVLEIGANRTGGDVGERDLHARYSAVGRCGTGIVPPR